MPKKISGAAKPKPDGAEQSKRFLETALEREVEVNGEAFGRAIGLVVPPAKPTKPAEQEAPHLADERAL
jgi:hypothetical protein